jgi:hypothetical protein
MSQSINNEEELIQIIQDSINRTKKNSIKILGGHLPLQYYDGGEGKKSVEFDVNRWGVFSTYTFELGVKALRYAKERGKDSKLLILVDDLVEIPITKLYNYGKVKRETVTKTLKRKRKQLYDSGIMPTIYEQILLDYDFSKENLIFHERKEGVRTPMISELTLKITATNKDPISTNECAQSYKGIVYTAEFFDINNDFLISFIPGQCKGNICTSLLDKEPRLSALHFFFPHITDLGGLIQLKNGAYIKNPKISPLRREDMFEREISYRVDNL